MTLPAPPYKITQIDGEPEQDAHGNSGAFIKLDKTGETGVLLRMKGVFPIVGDTITDRVLVEKESQKGTTYLKLEKPSRNGTGKGGAEQRRAEGPDEAYWAGQNAAKGRSAAQDRAISWLALLADQGLIKPGELAEELGRTTDYFEKDVHAARDRAVEEASPSGGARPSAPAPPDQAAMPPEPPTEPQVNLMLLEARKKGLDGPAMSAILKHRFGVERFSDLNKRDCVDVWRAALTEPVPAPDLGSDVPSEDPWPPTNVPEPANDDSIPF